jgi:hypothetical protein
MNGRGGPTCPPDTIYAITAAPGLEVVAHIYIGIFAGFSSSSAQRAGLD